MTLSETMRRLHPTAEPSDALTARIAALAEMAEKRRPTPLPVALTVGFVVAALALIVFFTTPKATTARTMETAYDNLQKAHNFHYRITFAPKTDTDSFTLEFWRQGASWRQDTTVKGKAFTQIVTNGLSWNLHPQEKSASYQKASVSTVPPSFDAEGAQKQMLQALHNAHGTNLGTVDENGQHLQKIAVAAPVQRFLMTEPESGRSVFWIDTRRLLPVRIEGQLRQNGQWRIVSTVEYDLAASIPPATFRIPAGVKTYSMQSLGTKAGSRFAHPLAQKRFASRTIALRNVQVNQDGDIFVLYTDGSTPTESRESAASVIRDDRGTVYAGTAGAIEPFMYCTDKAGNRGMVVDGQAMVGACVVPAIPAAGAWMARRIHIEIHFVEYVGKKTYTRTATFEVPVSKPSTKLLPTYASDLSMLALAGGDPAQFRQDREWGRRAHLYNARDWHGMIRSTDREIQQGTAVPHTYLDRAEAYRSLGDTEKTQSALAQAERADTLGAYGDAIANARRRQRTMR